MAVITVATTADTTVVISGGHWGGGYYAPGPDIYVAPEPYAYGYGGPAPCYGPYYEEDCGPPPPSGVSLFFGL